MTIDWNKPSKAEAYQIRIYPTGADCTSPYAICPASTQTARTYMFYPDANAGAYYTIEIRALNNTCSLEYSAWCSTSITIMANINVNFYLDNTAQATPIGGICQLSGATATNPGSGATLTAQGQFSSYPGTITGTTATIAAPYWPPVANNVVALTPGEWQPGSQYRCTCPSGCQYSGIASPQSGINFFLAAVDLTHTGWWQVKGGLVYAGQMAGTALNDPIPVMSCEAAAPACIPAMITKDRENTEDSAGIAITGGGNIDSSDEQGSQTGHVTDRASQAFAVGTVPRNRENYDYFYRLYSMGINPGASDDFAATANDAHKPTGEPLGDKRAFFHEGDLTIQSRWSVGSNDQVVIFVHGNLTIADPVGVESLIDVTEGGFLAFIVSGDIIIESSVGNADLDSLSSNIEGVFIADGTLRVESKGEASGGDQRFIGEGTFVGWSGVVLERDFSDGGTRKAENNARPAETFVYRPDFVRNVPERMAKPTYVWQETN